MKVILKIMYIMLEILAPPAFSNRQFSAVNLFKYYFWQKILRINSHVDWPVHRTSQVKCPEKIQRGNRNPGMGMGCYIDGRNGIIIGDNTWIGPRVSIISMEHNLNDYTQNTPNKPIKIGRDCWLATGSIITAGVELGDHVIVAAGAVVTKSFPSNVLIGEVPARIIQHLDVYQKKE
jgi:acetyltransferase-like isoleucine patch superfamily enzyme